MLLVLAFLCFLSRALAQEVVRWSADAPFANSYYYNGFEYRSIENDHLSLAIDRPTASPRATITAFNVIFDNRDIPRIDIKPDQFACLCVDKKGTGKALRYYPPPPGSAGQPLLANTVAAGKRAAGTMTFKGGCKRYLVRWQFEGQKVLEFLF